MTAASTRTQASALAPALRRGVKATPGDAKQHNRTLVLQTLHTAGPLSRADVARATGLTKVTVSGLVAELVTEGLLHELGQQESLRPGKPAILLDLARDAFAVVALDLSDHLTMRGAVVTIDGQVLSRAEVQRAGATGETASELAIQLACELGAAATVPLLGVGVGTPGVVDDAGVVRTAPNLGWEDLPLREMLAERTGLPTVVANDANVAALAEYSFGESSDNFILVTIGHGVGSGLIIDGLPVAGYRFASGEIGQVMVGTDLGLNTPYARDQVLEHWLSVPSLTQATGAAATPAERERVLREAGQRLGIALAPVVGVLNLAEIVLAGPLELIGATLADATREIITRRTMPDTHNDLLLRTSTQGADLILRGATATVVKDQLGIS
ncbi:ROK family transcriptional regulator [Leucobacter luti]|uniref:Putative NBD/HSP70 family sugar kinase n=1 Tax=Leucobacter luti TaxID=340320 RepID=A0A4R6RV65_9MICO|nr:ROK family transcriptional regulator [Leucobacter luti]MCW2289677.1 putative NBD/HSP70 family sugar kinase [Leucobacter luti]QYM77154.1 ROK family transcriptional regulator [Leucobacter luti]TCK37848.1 putative NBD/HSP70 family sugar kinase [Leucobacter luti]TDP90840.1 putative NBD/HSP70 family sugar kinase [Leucobacter luti]